MLPAPNFCARSGSRIFFQLLSFDFGSTGGAEAWETCPPFLALLIRRDKRDAAWVSATVPGCETRGENGNGRYGVAVTVMVTLTGWSSVVSGGAESGSARGGTASGDAGWVLGHWGGWLSLCLTPWVLLPAAAPGADGSSGAGAAPSSLLAAVSASSGMPMGSWAPGPALGEGR